MKINEIAQLVNTYGFLTIFGALALILLYRYFNKKIGNFSKSSEGEEMIRTDMIDNHNNDSIKSLLQHPFFCNIDNIIFLKIPNIDLGDAGRTRIFQDILSIQFKIILKNLREAIQTESITEDNFLDKNLEILRNSIAEYEKEWVNYGIPEIVIKKYKDWIFDRYEHIFNSLQSISKNSKIFDTLCLKQYVVLDNYASVLYMTTLDAEDVLSTLNGELTGVEYKGIVVGNLH